MTPAVVILHGWGLSSKTFTGLRKQLTKRGFHVFVPDLPGFGDAIIPTHALTLSDYVQFLHAYFEKNKIEKPIVIAHSFGGRVALRYLLDDPADFRALVLTGTPGFTPVPKRRLALFITIAKIGKLFFFIPFLSLLRDHVRRWYYYLVGARDYYRAQGVMRDTFKKIVQEELVSSMRAVRIPTLLVWGQYDIIVPLRIAQKMQQTIQKAQLIVIPGADHGVSYKRPGEFVQTIYDFMLSVTKH